MAEIKDFFGAEELKSFADKLVITAENAKARSSKYPLLPNLIFSCAPGCGVSSFIRKLASLIRDLKLMRFSGEEECFELIISDTEKAAKKVLLDEDRNIKNLLNRITTAAGFYSDFRGLIGLDMTSLFKEDMDFSKISQLMDFVDIHQGKILFVFIVPIDPPSDALSDFLHQFSNRTPVEYLRLPFPETVEILEFIRLRLSRSNMSLTDEAALYLTGIVEELRKDNQFKGYQTMKTLIEELVWHKLSSSTGKDGVIDSGDLDFLNDEDHLLGIVRTQLRNQNRPMGLY